MPATPAAKTEPSSAMSSRRPAAFRVDDSRFAFTTRRPVAILMVVLAVAVFGWVSYQRLALTLMPDISYPTLTVRTEYPGSAPEEVENIISRPLEQALGIVPRLVSLRSISTAGQSDVILEFQWKTDMTAIAQDIREKVDRVRLPDGAKRPLLLHYDPSLDPILRLGLTGPQPLAALRFLADNEIKRRLESLEGVAAVKVRGGLEEQFLVALDEPRLAVLGLDAQQIAQRLAQGNVNLPGGSLREGQTEYLIRTLNEFRTLEEIGALVVQRREGIDIRLRDIATVTRHHKDRDVITRVNGRESVEIEVYKEADANVVAVARRVRDQIFGLPVQQAYVRSLAATGGQPPPPQVKADASPQDRRRAQAQQNLRHRQLTDFVAHTLPPGNQIEVLTDQSVFIANSIDEVKRNALFGGLIAVAVLFLFLRRLSHTLIVGLAIPVSIVATFAPMFLAGVSLNLISLGGLALGVGMLVDNAIVVLESIFRCREEGDDPVTAVVRGTSEVGSAVVASTLTTVAVFFPIVFVEGVAGQVFGDLALTVVFSLLASLAAALFFIPMLASRQLGSAATAATTAAGGVVVPEHPIRTRWAKVWQGLAGGLARTGRWAVRQPRSWLPLRLVPALGAVVYVLVRFVLATVLAAIATVLGLIGAALLWIVTAGARGGGRGLGRVVRPVLDGFEAAFGSLRAGYPRLLQAAIDARGPVLVGAAAAFLACWFLVVPRLGRELIPQVHQGEFNLDISLPVGTPLPRTDEVASLIELAVAAEPEVARTALTVGAEDTATASSEAGEHTARLTVRLHPGTDARREQALIDRIRTRFADLPETRLEVGYPVLFSFKSPIEVEVRGHDLATLRRLSREAEARLRNLPGLVDVRSTFQSGNPEIAVVYHRDRLAEHGLALRPVAELVRTKVQGRVPTVFREDDRQIDILVRLREEDRFSLAELARLTVNPGAPIPVPLSAVATLTVQEGPSQIRRIDQQRAAVLTANLRDRDLATVSADIAATLQEMTWPPGFSFAVAGQNREMQTSLDSMLLALALALFLVYIVMASQFESLVQPLLIMATVPLAIIGVSLALFAFGMSLSILVFIGLIVLAGIVVNNAIVLVDYINTLRARGLERRAAIVEAGTARLRPILMTTLTTVLGLLPMALGLGEGAEIRAPMAVTVIVGLATSTLLTLVVVPVLYFQFGGDRASRAEAPAADEPALPTATPATASH
jgi:HAE1 family hydrophobic/amphiphilic exporter-1